MLQHQVAVIEVRREPQPIRCKTKSVGTVGQAVYERMKRCYDLRQYEGVAGEHHSIPGDSG